MSASSCSGADIQQLWQALVDANHVGDSIWKAALQPLMGLELAQGQPHARSATA